MDFAADAVFDVATPPTRSAPARAQSKANDGPSFDDHLESVSARAEPPTRSEAAIEARSEGDAPDAEESAATSETQAAPSELPTPALVVQIIASPQPTLTAAPDAIALTPTATEIASAAPAAAPQPQTPEQPADGTPKFDAAKAEGADSKSVSAPVANAPATPVADAAQSPASALPIATAPAQPVLQQSAESPIQPAPAAPAVASLLTPASAPRDAPPRTPKAAATATAPQTETQASGVKPANIEPPPSKTASTPVGATAARSGDAQAPPPSTPDSAALPPPPSAAPSFAQQAAHTQQAVSADHNAARAAPVAAQVAREIVRQFNGATTSFDLRLDPPELGRVEIRLEVTRDHRVTAVVAADNPQALAELARHARELEQTLQSAGLELSDNGLSFDLRQGGEGDPDTDKARGGGHSDSAEAQAEQPILTSRPLGFERWRGVRVDLMV